MLIDAYLRRTRWERWELAAAVANPAHYLETISGQVIAPSGQTAPTNGHKPTGEVGGINYHPPPAIGKLARAAGGFKVRG